MLFELVMASVSREESDLFKELLREYFSVDPDPSEVLDLAYEEDIPEAVSEFSQRLVGLMVKEAFGWIRAGATVDLKDVRDWHRSERYCYKLAGELYEGRQTFAHGMASRGPFEAARFLAAVDDGKFHDEMVLDHYADKLADLMS